MAQVLQNFTPRLLTQNIWRRLGIFDKSAAGFDYFTATPRHNVRGYLGRVQLSSVGYLRTLTFRLVRNKFTVDGLNASPPGPNQGET